MLGVIWIALCALALPSKSMGRLEAENAILRQQIIVLRRRVHGRVKLTNVDRAVLVQVYRSFPSVLRALVIVRPETVIRWHWAGFRAYWHWKSRRRGRRPRVDHGLRTLIRHMSLDNPLWGAPRIHGELPKLGYEVAQSTVAKYMAKGAARQIRTGEHFCATMPGIPRRLTCSWSRPLASTCSMPWSLLG
jgi:hypothetical protein